MPEKNSTLFVQKEGAAVVSGCWERARWQCDEVHVERTANQCCQHAGPATSVPPDAREDGGRSPFQLTGARRRGGGAWVCLNGASGGVGWVGNPRSLRFSPGFFN